MGKEIVATARSKYGGKCQSDNHEVGPIKVGDPIYKVATEGETTTQGQGPGYWICEVCAEEFGH